MTQRKEISIAKIELTEHEIAAATAVLRSGALRQGEQCAAFEAEYAECVGAEHAVTCANGSAALHLPFFCMLEPGDEVIVPSFTFIATASMVALTGAKPVFCDVDPDSFLLDLGVAEHLVTERTKMVVPVHLFGNPCSRRDTRAFADRHGLAVVWDAAQGSFGHAGWLRRRCVGRRGCVLVLPLEEHVRRRRRHGVHKRHRSRQAPARSS